MISTLAAERFPELHEPLDRGRLGVLRRGEDAPAVDEQLGEARVGPGIFGAGDGMARDEMDAGRNVGRHVAHHRGLDRADIGDGRARLEVRADLFRHRAAGADRNADDHQIGAGDRGRAGVHDFVGETQFADALPRRLGSRRRNDFAHDAERARRARDRAADQADADQRQAVEEDWRSHHCRPKKSLSAATTSRLASSVPTLSRSAFGSL